jgi:hypothetical protein
MLIPLDVTFSVCLYSTAYHHHFALTEGETMAKKVTKTTRVRDYLAAHPDASPKEAATKLRKYGITATYISNIKAREKKQVDLVANVADLQRWGGVLPPPRLLFHLMTAPLLSFS